MSGAKKGSQFLVYSTIGNVGTEGGGTSYWANTRGRSDLTTATGGFAGSPTEPAFYENTVLQEAYVFPFAATLKSIQIIYADGAVAGTVHVWIMNGNTVLAGSFSFATGAGAVITKVPVSTFSAAVVQGDKVQIAHTVSAAGISFNRGRIVVEYK